MSREILRTKTFVADAANFIVDLARKALAERNEFRIALSGGNTPRPIYTELARTARDLSWEKMLITFGDERCVPPDDEQSNYRMARETLFVPAAVPDKSIMRMRGEIDPQIAAQEYQDNVDLLAAQRGEQIYRHDLILLGLGEVIGQTWTERREWTTGEEEGDGEGLSLELGGRRNDLAELVGQPC